MAERNGAVVLVFARAPVPGQAKTRLIPVLGERAAADLHAGLLAQTLLTVAELDTDIQLWTSPDTSHPVIQHLAVASGVSLHRQCEGDLGQRMASALQQALAHYERAVLIGTDCPDLTPEVLTDAFDRLAAEEDWVIGPAEDGGYYLVGAKAADEKVFSHIDWGSSRVWQQTLSRFASLGHAWSELTCLRDVDRPEDLLWFAAYPSVIERGKEIVELAG